MFLRQSTSQVVRFGPFLDSTDFITAETALTIAQADMQLSKDGGAFAQKNATGNATHDADGWYSTTLNTTDTNTVGELYLQVVVTGSIPVWVRWWVIEEAVYDAMYGASAAGPLQSTTAGRTLDVTATGAAGIDWGNVENPTTAVDLSGTDIQLCDTTTTVTNQVTADVTAVSGDTTAANNLEADYDGTGYNKSNSTIGTCTTNTDMRGTDSAYTGTPPTAEAIADAVLDEDMTAHQTTGTLGQAIGDPGANTKTLYAALIDDATGASVTADVATVDTVVDGIQTDLDNGTDGLGAIKTAVDACATPAEVNTEVQDVLNTDAHAEPTGVPAANESLGTKIGYLFMALRNRVDITSTKKTFYDDGGAGEWEKDLSDDGTTYSESEGNAI